MPEITLVLGVDAKTLPQFEVSSRTWRRNQPQIYSWPWVVFYDMSVETMPDILLAAQNRGQFPEQTKFVCWPGCVGGDHKTPAYEHQRERMLSGFPYVAAQYVQTPWWAKIDTDAICHRASDWPREDWFAAEDYPQTTGGTAKVTPQVIAPGWGYTKGIGFLDRLEEWGDKTALGALPRLNIPSEPGQLRVPHPRWCSWNSFYDTAWTKAIVGWLAESGLEPGKLPIPSQDSWMWYCAERSRRLVRKVNMKKHGWCNKPKLADLIATAQAVMRGEATSMGADT